MMTRDGMVDYSSMTREQIAAHVEVDAHNWEWSVDECGKDVEPKYGADERYVRRASQEDEDMLAELLGKR